MLWPDTHWNLGHGTSRCFDRRNSVLVGIHYSCTNLRTIHLPWLTSDDKTLKSAHGFCGQELDAWSVFIDIHSACTHFCPKWTWHRRIMHPFGWLALKIFLDKIFHYVRFVPAMSEILAISVMESSPTGKICSEVRSKKKWRTLLVFSLYTYPDLWWLAFSVIPVLWKEVDIMVGPWRVELWEGFFNQSAVGMFRLDVSKGKIATKVRGQDK